MKTNVNILPAHTSYNKLKHYNDYNIAERLSILNIEYETYVYMVIEKQ